MLAYLAMIAAAPPFEQPMAHAPAFQCTATWFHAESGVVGCREAITISLWGLVFPRRETLPIEPGAFEHALRSVFLATSVGPQVGGYSYIRGGPKMNCFSFESQPHRVSQCVVPTRPLFGGKELECEMIHSRIARAARFARKAYARCAPDIPQLMLG